MAAVVHLHGLHDEGAGLADEEGDVTLAGVGGACNVILEAPGRAALEDGGGDVLDGLESFGDQIGLHLGEGFAFSDSSRSTIADLT